MVSILTLTEDIRAALTPAASTSLSLGFTLVGEPAQIYPSLCFRVRLYQPTSNIASSIKQVRSGGSKNPTGRVTGEGTLLSAPVAFVFFGAETSPLKDVKYRRTEGCSCR